MKDITLFLAVPRAQCGCTEQECPLLRVCPGCGYRFITTRGRRQHQNGCNKGSPLNAALVQAQHDHLIEVHRIRRRRSTR